MKSIFLRVSGYSFIISVFCAGSLLDDQKSNGYYTPNDKPDLLPPDITSLLCTAEQATW